MIFAVRTMVGQEKNIAGLMASRAEKEQLMFIQYWHQSH